MEEIPSLLKKQQKQNGAKKDGNCPFGYFEGDRHTVRYIMLSIAYMYAGV